MSLVCALLGALLALAWGDYHNEHVNVLVGGWIVKGDGFLMLALAGFCVGWIIGRIIEVGRRPES